MRIGQLTEVYKPFVNGVTNFISLHKRVLESWGHKVFVFTLGHEDYEDDELHVIRSPAIPLSDTGYHLSFRFSRRARKKIKTMDVLHVHHPFISGRQAISLGKRYDIPVVFTNHTRTRRPATQLVPRECFERVGNRLVDVFPHGPGAKAQGVGNHESTLILDDLHIGRIVKHAAFDHQPRPVRVPLRALTQFVE